MPDIKVTIGTDVYREVEVFFERDYDFFGKSIEVILPEWNGNIVGGEVLTVYRDEVVWTRGKVKKIQPKVTLEGSRMHVIAYTYETEGAWEQIPSRTYNADPAAIITAALNSDLTAGTINNYGSNIAMEFGSDDIAKWPKNDVIKRVCFVTGWEDYVNPTGILDFKSACGTDRSTTRIFRYRELLTFWHQPHLVNKLYKATKVIVLGKGEGTLMVYGVGGVGSRIHTEPAKDLISSATCALAAAALYADMQNDVIKGAFDCIIDPKWTGMPFDIYDTIRIEDPRYNIAANYRIYRIEYSLSRRGEWCRVFYTNLTKLAGNGAILLSLRRDALTSGQKVTSVVARDSVNVINKAALDASGNIDLGAAAGFVNKNLDNVADGVIYGRGLGRSEEIYLGHRHTRFTGESADGFTISLTGTASVSIKTGLFTLQTGTTNGSVATIRSESETLAFNKNPSLKVLFEVSSITNISGRMEMGYLATSNATVGFKISDDKLQYYVFNNSAGQTDDLLTLVPATEYYIEAIVDFAAGAIRFYVNGVLMHTHTGSPFPDATDKVLAFDAAIQNLAAANKILKIKHWSVTVDWS